jgi:hypothetical protein
MIMTINKNIQKYVEDSHFNKQLQRMSGRVGVVSSYDPRQNTATVLISKEQTDEIEEVLTDVHCPRTLGVQEVAPGPGLLCWVAFKDNNITQPLITHFFNHRYEQFDYDKHNSTPDVMPNYLLGL